MCVPGTYTKQTLYNFPARLSDSCLFSLSTEINHVPSATTGAHLSIQIKPMFCLPFPGIIRTIIDNNYQSDEQYQCEVFNHQTLQWSEYNVKQQVTKQITRTVISETRPWFCCPCCMTAASEQCLEATVWRVCPCCDLSKYVSASWAGNIWPAAQRNAD